MKKILIAAAVIIVVLFGVAAFRDGYTEESEGIITFGQTKTGLLAGEISTLENAKEMLAALCENRPDDAKKLMHKELPESYQNAIRQMTDYLAGRKVARMDVLEKNVNQIISASGKTKREQVTYEVELNDGNILYFNTVATLESFDPGFTCCEIILGVDRESLKQKLFNLSASVIKSGDAESFSEVQKMLLALSEKRTSDAMTLMHEDVAESYADAIAQLEEYFAGREVNVIKPMQSSVQNSITLTGKKSLEETYYAAHLIDGDLISLKVKYLSDKADSGFAIFYIGIGGVLLNGKRFQQKSGRRRKKEMTAGIIEKREEVLITGEATKNLVFLFSFGDEEAENDIEKYRLRYRNFCIDKTNGKLYLAVFESRDPNCLRLGSVMVWYYEASYMELKRIVLEEDIKDGSKYESLNEDTWREWLTDNHYRL